MCLPSFFVLSDLSSQLFSCFKLPYSYCKVKLLMPFVAFTLFEYLTIMDFVHLLRCGTLGGDLDSNADGCLGHGAPYYNFRQRTKALLRGVCAVGLATPAADVLLRGVFTPILHSRTDCLSDFLTFTRCRWNVNLQPAQGLEAVARLRGFPNLLTFLTCLNVHTEVADFMLELFMLGDGYLLLDALPFDGHPAMAMAPQQWHPAMAPSNGTQQWHPTWTPPKLAPTPPPIGSKNPYS